MPPPLGAKLCEMGDAIGELRDAIRQSEARLPPAARGPAHDLLQTSGVPAAAIRDLALALLNGGFAEDDPLVRRLRAAGRALLPTAGAEAAADLIVAVVAAGARLGETSEALDRLDLLVWANRLSADAAGKLVEVLRRRGALEAEVYAPSIRGQARDRRRSAVLLGALVRGGDVDSVPLLQRLVRDESVIVWREAARAFVQAAPHHRPFRLEIEDLFLRNTDAAPQRRRHLAAGLGELATDDTHGAAQMIRAALLHEDTWVHAGAAYAVGRLLVECPRRFDGPADAVSNAPADVASLAEGLRDASRGCPAPPGPLAQRVLDRLAADVPGDAFAASFLARARCALAGWLGPDTDRSPDARLEMLVGDLAHNGATPDRLSDLERILSDLHVAARALEAPETDLRLTAAGQRLDRLRSLTAYTIEEGLLAPAIRLVAAEAARRPLLAQLRQVGETLETVARGWANREEIPWAREGLRAWLAACDSPDVSSPTLSARVKTIAAGTAGRDMVLVQSLLDRQHPALERLAAAGLERWLDELAVAAPASLGEAALRLLVCATPDVLERAEVLARREVVLDVLGRVRACRRELDDAQEAGAGVLARTTSVRALLATLAPGDLAMQAQAALDRLDRLIAMASSDRLGSAEFGRQLGDDVRFWQRFGRNRAAPDPRLPDLAAGFSTLLTRPHERSAVAHRLIDHESLRSLGSIGEIYKHTISTVGSGTSAPGSSPQMPPQPGDVVDGYQLDARFPTSGMADVFRATYLANGRTVVLKFLPVVHCADPVYRMRLGREAAGLLQARHPHVVPLQAYQSNHDPPYLVMEYVDGPDLAHAHARKLPLPVDAALPKIRAIASAVASVHGVGIVLRDLKPGNVIERATDGALVLIDFGLALLSGWPTVTREGDWPLTPHYASREQWLGHDLSPKVDVYALGIMAYEMLVGHVPFPYVPIHEVRHGHVELPHPPLPPSIPEDVRKLVDAMLSKEPKHRPSALEVIATIDGWHTATAATLATHP